MRFPRMITWFAVKEYYIRPAYIYIYIYRRSIENDCVHLVERDSWSRKKHFIPRGGAQNRVTGVFNKIRRPTRRAKWKYARSAERLCGRGEACPVCKTGVRLDNDGIHPSVPPRGAGTPRRGQRTVTEIKRERERGNFFFFLHFLPLPWACIVIKKTRSELAIRSRARFAGREPLGENFPRERKCSSRIQSKYLQKIPLNI